MEKTFDVIVVGAGAMGSATLYQLSKRSKRVLGLDQFSPPHSNGSSHGETRLTRQAIGEGDEYIPLVLRSYEIWNELEKLTGKNLLAITGGLFVASPKIKTSHHGVAGFLDQTIAVAKRHGIPHAILDSAQIRRQFPQFNPGKDEIGYYENSAGFLRPEACIETQLALAQKNGAQLHTNEKLLEFIPAPGGDSITVRTDRATYTTEKLVLSAGPWMSGLLGKQYSDHFKVYRQVLHWFDFKENDAPFLKDKFPVFIWVFGNGSEDMFYGFPSIDGPQGGLKVATEQFRATTTPDTVTREVAEEESRQMYRNCIETRFPGLSARCVKAASCLYTVTQDSRFILDAHPQFPNVTIVSPCSGHGFKHSAAIGEAVAERVMDGRSKIDLAKFSFERFRQLI